MGRRLEAAVILALLALMAAPLASAQEMCRFNSSWGEIEYPCEQAQGATKDEEETPWWARTEFEVALAVVGLVGSAGAATYGFVRMRRRRRTLADLLEAVERAYADHKETPVEGVSRLVALRQELREKHRRGRIEDVHFLELDRRTSDRIVRLRLRDLDHRFRDLPPLLLSELRVRLSDGQVSRQDVQRISLQASVHRVAPERREELVRVVRAWADQDVDAEVSEGEETVAAA